VVLPKGFVVIGGKPCSVQRIIKRDSLIEKDCLLAIQEALVGFLMDEVVNPQGKHHYDSNPIDRLTSKES
jgi:hypothetical protein